MSAFYQGDIIKISGFGQKLFVIVSKNAFIKATSVFHICPMLENVPEGPLHIAVSGKNTISGVVICEQIKMIDPAARSCRRIDSLHYGDIMNISDAIQGMFDYD